MPFTILRASVTIPFEHTRGLRELLDRTIDPEAIRNFPLPTVESPNNARTRPLGVSQIRRYRTRSGPARNRETLACPGSQQVAGPVGTFRGVRLAAPVLVSFPNLELASME